MSALRPYLRIYTPADMPADDGAITQMETCMDSGDALAGVLCADHHLGYSMPIGGVVAYPDYISPSGVGYDIACGNKAVATSLLYSDISDDLSRIMDEIAKRISFGMGRNNESPVDHAVFDRINRDAPLPGVRNLLGLARKQLGTVGGGNHYVDLFAEERTDRVWIGVHFGSRGFGHKIATGFMALAQGLEFDGRPGEEGLFAPPILLHTDSALGHMYIDAMEIAGEYAYAGRDTVVDEVLSILGNPWVLHDVHNHHNFAWREEVDGSACWVIRKGATPLYPGQQGFVGGSMGENAVIIEGKPIVTEADQIHAAMSLDSAPHGAGRVMSRTEAKGKQKNRWYCKNCGWIQTRGIQAPKDEGYGVRCPECLDTRMAKKWVIETEGKIDWKAAKKDLKQKGIHLRGGEADEAPGAYKRLPAVLKAHERRVRVVHQLRPIGVVMAAANVRDLYKD